MSAVENRIPPGNGLEWAPCPGFTAIPVARDGRDNGCKAETGV